ncbi:MAG: Gldg family protein [Planctomycetes bacterium]|nr:Gldg family protein [Planctomycetota bacterium]
MIHGYAIRALCFRQLSQFLGNPLGYIFLLVFTIVCASFLFLPDTFFVRNICDLQPLLPIMPWLLAVLLPALAMGTWAGERELHTDETLLSLPISVTDAIIGKWLAISIYFTISLAATLSNVFVLSMLGNPDYGLIFCNYCGWALYGYILSAAALCASSLVPVPAIAFILGCLFCTSCVAVMKSIEWSSGFDRGAFNPSSIFSSIAAIGIFLVISIIWISSSRWQKRTQKLLIKQICIAFLCIIFFVNCARIAYRYCTDIDMSSDQLSTLSDASYTILHKLDRPIVIHVFIQQNLPREWQQRGQELEHMLRNIQRATPEHINIFTHRPADSLDQSAELARRHYALPSRRVETQHVTGTEQTDIFLGAILSNGSDKERIPFFEKGLSIEYECIRAIDSLGQKTRPVLGIARNDFPLLGGYNSQLDRMEAEQKIVSEWRKRYDVIELDLRKPVHSIIDVLVVAMPSSLTQKELENLNAYIWHGRPCLLLDDPAPMWSKIECAPSFSRDQLFAKVDQRITVNQEPKGNIDPLYRSLGISFQRQQVSWSEYNPSNRLRAMWPKAMLWTDRRNGGITDHPAMTGIDSLLFPYPGRLAAYPQKNIQLTALMQSSANSAWGLHNLSDYISYSENFGFRNHKPQDYTAEEHAGSIIGLAVSGNMPSAYAIDPHNMPQTQNSVVGDQADNSTTAFKNIAIGTESSANISCIVIADVDFIHNQFYNLYSNGAAEFHDDDLSLIRQLQNIQFSANCIDILLGDTSLLALRNRHITHRSLTKVEQVRMRREATKKNIHKELQKKSMQRIKELENKLNDTIIEIMNNTEESEQNKQNQIQALKHQAYVDSEDITLKIKRSEQHKIKETETAFQRILIDIFNTVRKYALGIPGVILSSFAGIVFFIRRSRERQSIPASRLRDQP